MNETNKDINSSTGNEQPNRRDGSSHQFGKNNHKRHHDSRNRHGNNRPNRNDRGGKEQNNNRQQNNGRNRNERIRSNNYGFPRIENEPREERAPSLNIPVDDHPRAMVLPFDKKAVEDVRPRKYTSGYEIYKINLNLARWLTHDDYLNKISEATGVSFLDKGFYKLEGETVNKLKAYSDSRLAEPKLDKPLRQFYKYMSYYCSYAIENNTAVVFDL